MLACSGMVLLTEGALQTRASALLLLNIFVRLSWPSACKMNLPSNVKI